MLQRTLSTITLVVVANFLSGCGFHLRGNIDIPENLLPIQIIDTRRGAEITAVLLRELPKAGLSTVKSTVASPDDSKSAKTLMYLESENFNKKTLSLSSGSGRKAKTLNIQYTVHYRLKSRLSDYEHTQSITVVRALEFEQGAVLSSASEEKIIEKELLADAVQQIIRRLSNVKINLIAVE